MYVPQMSHPNDPNDSPAQQQEETDSSEDDHAKNLTTLRAQSASPLVGRGKTPAKGIVDRTGSPLGASKREEETDETEDEESEIARAESDDPDEWFPASSRPLSTTTNVQRGSVSHLQQAPPPIFETDVKAGRTRAQPGNKRTMSVSELTHDLGGLDLASEKTPQKTTRSTRQVTRVSVTEDEDSIIVVPSAKDGEGQKKKKR